MKIVDAFWEEPNIGLKTLELTFEEAAEPLPLEAIAQYQYIVAKVPGTNIPVIHNLEREGFRFMEAQLNLSKRLKEVKFDPRVAQFAKGFAFEEIDSREAFRAILDEVEQGLFDTDRIFLDPLLGAGPSRQRYRNWMETMFGKREQYRYFAISEKASGKGVGFVCMDLSNNEVSRGVLAGIYENYKNSGLGFLIIYFPLAFSISAGKTHYRTSISVNNLAVLNLYNFFSFQVEACYSVLRKFNQ